MSSIKRSLFYILNKLALGVSIQKLIPLAEQNIILPFYHTISDKPLAHIKHLYPIKTVKDFIQDLDFLLQYFEPMTLEEFISYTKNKNKRQKPGFLLSFDDGLVEFYTTIAPILKEKGIPAVCFLNSAFIDNENLFFRFKCSLIIDYLVQNPDKIRTVLNSNLSLEEYKNYLLSLKYHDSKELDSVALLLDISFENFLKDQKPYLSSTQIQELIKDGFYFGAHSIDHPQYQYLTEKEQIRQTVESATYIQNKFQLNYKIFSFPFTDFGVGHNYFEAIEKENILDLSFGCAGQKRDSAANNYQRIVLESGNLGAKEIIHQELARLGIKKILNKDLISRND